MPTEDHIGILKSKKLESKSPNAEQLSGFGLKFELQMNGNRGA
jgi:hypothetical protein